jgi:hypothetical protein
MTRCVALSLFAAGLFLSTAASGQPSAASSAASVDTSIVLVRVAGAWQAGGRSGFSRLIVTGAANRVSLSVEWIGSDGAIVQTQPLAAPPGAEQLPLARIRNQGSGADTSVTFDTPAGDTFVLVVGAPGEATFGPATN